MAANTVFVANLPWSTTTEDLRTFCTPAGSIVDAKVIEYRPGRSAGVGTVTFATSQDAQRAVDTLHDKELGGRPILVRADRPEAERPRTRGNAEGGGRRRRRNRRRPDGAAAPATADA